MRQSTSQAILVTHFLASPTVKKEPVIQIMSLLLTILLAFETASDISSITSALSVYFNDSVFKSSGALLRGDFGLIIIM